MAWCVWGGSIVLRVPGAMKAFKHGLEHPKHGVAGMQLGGGGAVLKHTLGGALLKGWVGLGGGLVHRSKLQAVTLLWQKH